MTISSKQDGKTLTLRVEGSVDTLTAPELTAEVEKIPDSIEELVFDFEKVIYISSAGLRSLVYAYKKMDGEMKIVHVNEILMEVFEVTGLTETLNIQ